jgi:large subunit ribosomal protein L18
MGEYNTKKTREIRHKRVRKSVSGTAERPRLCVYRSLSHS